MKKEMNTKYNYPKGILQFLVIILVALQGCKEEEFIPRPVGETLPPLEYPLLSEALNESGLTLFAEAWKRSDIENFIVENYPRNQFTILAPNDDAMQAAGYTAATIGSARKVDLDTLIRYHVLIGEVSQERLKMSTAAQTFGSLLTHPEFLETESGNTGRPYRYQHVLHTVNDGLSDNGALIEIEEEIPVENGRIIPIDRMVERPKKQMIDVLREDGRFSLFVCAMELNGKIYDDYVLNNFSSTNFSPFKYLTDWYAQTEGGYRSTEFLPHVIRFTLFAPTNDAFHRAGIYSEADIIALNQRSALNLNYGGSTPSDSLLINQKIGLSRMSVDFDWDLFIPGALIFGHNSAANAVFYSYSLNNRLLQDYILQVVNGQPAYLGYDFGKDASDMITVKQKASTAEPATIIEENINTIQGPIHVVDRIIVPEGFSMWHK